MSFNTKTEIASGAAYGELSPSPHESPEELLKFTGHERDLLSGGDAHLLDYMHSRYYMSAAGRFLSVDSHPGHPELPQSWNRYSYARDNPLTLLDPNGKEAIVFVVSSSNIVRDLSGAFGHTAIWVSANGGSNGWSFGGDFAFRKGQGYGDFLKSYQAEGRSVDVFELKTTPAQDAAMLSYINNLEKNPGEFGIWSNNCTTTTWGVLQAGGLIPNEPLYCSSCGGEILNKPAPISPEGLEGQLKGPYSSIVQRQYTAPAAGANQFTQGWTPEQRKEIEDFLKILGDALRN